jgi:FKBP-type peptidyl-prolyl cis-trans isomerase
MPCRNLKREILKHSRRSVSMSRFLSIFNICCVNRLDDVTLQVTMPLPTLRMGNRFLKGIMKIRLLAILAIALVGCQQNTDKEKKLETQKDKVSYIIGLNVGGSFKRDAVDVNPDAFLLGLKTALGDEKPLINEQEMDSVMEKFQREMMAKQQEMEGKNQKVTQQQTEESKKLAEKNKKDGEMFLAANKKKPGVITRPSGLQYKVIKEGKGPTPKATDTVSTHYRGVLINGKEFDSSARAGKPVTFPVSNVIPGWVEALQLMKVGSKWQLFIPAHLAYGDRGMGADIPPNSTLIFDIELVEIKK